MKIQPLLLVPAAGLLLAAAPPEADREPPTRDYWAYVCAESEDEVSLVRFGPQGAEVAKTIEVGSFPAEIEGPHGIQVSPSGRYWYVSMSHGMPFGSIHKYATGTDEWEGDVTVGMFPATLDVAGTTGLLYVVNADFFGDHLPSTISVVETGTMTEVRQIPTGTMPHGARLSRDGKRLYSVNMMDDELMEHDALRFEVSRRLELGAGGHAAHGAHHDGASRVEPSWVTAPTASGKVYVAALSGNQILEVDLDSFTVARRLPSGVGPYNLAVTADERLLVVTYKKSDAVGFWDLESGVELARVATTRRIPHGVAITGDGRYSFVTVEGVGGEPGVVEIFDNRRYERVGLVEVGKQAGGIAVWERGG
ncbi:MAG TPA: YncE family protein [Thermoanaerobaculia bacterium]|nr:YncE family protein [Thermoanaerobaculia bacterium]